MDWDFLEEAGESAYTEYKRKIDALSYQFSSDLKHLETPYKANFEIDKNGQYPTVMRLYLERKLSVETFTILTNLSNVFPYWEADLSDKILSKNILRTAKKYYPFLNIDKQKFKSIIKEQFFSDK